ncbi:MAG: phosphatidylglycerophosphatase A [Acidobacteria bacterium]|nr:phosphatidylglycerophosphatase A [Acidobacteriota bacterium]
MRNWKFLEFRAKRGRSIKISDPADQLALIIATGFGIGFIPFAPGTFGSILGLLIAYFLMSIFSHDVILLQNSIIIVSVILAILGIWASSRAEKIFDQKDAGQIVLDEVCGQLISFLFIAPYIRRLGGEWIWWGIAGFFLFRALDIIKPYPLKELEQIRGGLGVMLDDIIAGIYAAVVLSIALLLITD